MMRMHANDTTRVEGGYERGGRGNESSFRLMVTSNWIQMMRMHANDITRVEDGYERGGIKIFFFR